MVTYTGHPNWTMEILDDNTFGVLEYHGDDTVVTIPSDVCGKKVTKRGTYYRIYFTYY